MTPRVTIGVPTFNAEATLAETLTSLLGQTHEDLEVLVSDNASTDDTVRIAEKFDDPRLRIVVHEENLGAEANSQGCWERARGEFTGIFHADDVYEPPVVARQVAFLDAHPDVGGVFTRVRYIDEAGRPGDLSLLPPALARGSGPVAFDLGQGLAWFLRHGNFIPTPAMLVRTSVYKDTVRTWHTDRFGKGADFDMWLRILEAHGLGCIPGPLVRYRWGRHGFSQAHTRLRTDSPDYIRVLDAWLARSDVQGLVGNDDLRAYARLKRKHDVVRANNALLKGEEALAHELIARATSRDLVPAALTSRRDLRVLAAWGAVRVGLVAPRLARPILQRIARRGG